MNQQTEPTRATSRAIPWWVTTIVILGALLTAAGGIIALVRPEILLEPNQTMNAAAGIYSGYLVSRNLALAAMLLITLALKARRELAGLMLLTVLIQVIDAVVDTATGRVALLPILAVFVVAFLVGVAQLRRVNSNVPE